MKILLAEATSSLGAAIRGPVSAAGHRVASDLTDADAVIWTSSSSDPEADEAAVCDALEALHGTGKAFVFTSGAWVHGDTGGKVVDETAHLHPPAIVAWRADLEKAVIEAPGVRGVVIRPGIVYGHGGGIPAMMVAEARRRGSVRMPGDGENHWPVVHIDDLTDLYIRAVEHAPAGTVLLAVHRMERLKDVARAASEAGGGNGDVMPWPIDDARRVLGEVADALALDQRLASKRALRLLAGGRSTSTWSPTCSPGLLPPALSGGRIVCAEPRRNGDRPQAVRAPHGVTRC